VRSIVVAVTGPSGAGKTTVVGALVRRFGWEPLDEAYYRLRPRPSLRFGSMASLRALEARLLREEARRYGEALAVARLGRTVVADTGFLDPVSYTAGLVAAGLATPAALRSIAQNARRLAERGALGLPDVLVRLAGPVELRRRRVEADPRGHPRAFRARHEAVGTAETEAIVPALARQFPGRVRVVPATAPVLVVAARVRSAVARTRPLRDPSRAALRAIEAIVGAVPTSLGSRKVKSGTFSPRPPR
jgi:thymidylate kinase